MQKLEKLSLTFDVTALKAELEEHPELWNDFDMRTNHPLSPHRDMSDIFVRYNARENYTGDRQEFNKEHDAVWWDAADKLPTAKKIALDLMQALQGKRLGMVLITRLPAGKACFPHIDNGWHAGYFDKYAIQIAANDRQSFWVEDESLSVIDGEGYRFDNSKPHWVLNESDEDRLTMIICINSGVH